MKAGRERTRAAVTDDPELNSSAHIGRDAPARHRGASADPEDAGPTSGRDPFDLLFALTSDPVVVLDAAGKLASANPAFHSVIRGMAPADDLTDLLVGDPADLRRYLDQLASGDTDESASFDAVFGSVGSGDGGDRPVRIVWRGGRRSGFLYLVGTVMETEPGYLRSRSADPLLDSVRAHLPVSGEDGSADDLMRVLGDGLGWEAASLWLPSADDSHLRCSGFWGLGQLGTGDFALATRAIRFERGLGLIGRVWESRREEWLDDVTTLSDYVRIGPARREHLRTTFVIPFDRGERCAGVLEFYARSVRKPEAVGLDRTRRIAVEIGRSLGPRD